MTQEKEKLYKQGNNNHSPLLGLVGKSISLSEWSQHFELKIVIQVDGEYWDRKHKDEGLCKKLSPHYHVRRIMGNANV